MFAIDTINVRLDRCYDVLMFLSGSGPDLFSSDHSTQWQPNRNRVCLVKTLDPENTI